MLFRSALLDGIKYFGALFDGSACADGQTGADMCNGAVAADLGACAHHDVLSEDAALDHCACLDHDAIHQDGILDRCALFHDDACAQHRVLDAAVDLAALSDQRILHDSAGVMFMPKSFLELGSASSSSRYFLRTSQLKM